MPNPLHAARLVLSETVVEAGGILLRHFGRIRNIRRKEHAGSVVCEADLASEAHVLRRLRSAFPLDGIVAEESGYHPGASGYTWAVDPLDGTSNFVAGLPWFGVQAGLFRGTQPVLAAIYLPIEQKLYVAEKGRGLTRDGKRLQLPRDQKLSNVLCAFGFDPGGTPCEMQRTLRLLCAVATGVRNLRATNSLMDFIYTLEGRLGGAVNLNTRIWDIVPFAVMLPEAGGRLSDLAGQPIAFEPAKAERNYAVVGASRSVHRRLIQRLRQS